jgi:hypothetical protein
MARLDGTAAAQRPTKWYRVGERRRCMSFSYRAARFGYCSCPVDVGKPEADVAQRATDRNIGQRQTGAVTPRLLSQLVGIAFKRLVDLSALPIYPGLTALAIGASGLEKAATAASSTPSARASQRFTLIRSRPDAGISRLFGATVSRYSAITRESIECAVVVQHQHGNLSQGIQRADLVVRAPRANRGPDRSRSSFPPARREPCGRRDW